MILALETYLPTYHQGPEAVIVNISSIAGVIGTAHVPIYSATKHAVIGEYTGCTNRAVARPHVLGS